MSVDERGFGQLVFPVPDTSFNPSRSLTLLSQRIIGISTCRREAELEKSKNGSDKIGRYLLSCLLRSTMVKIEQSVDNPKHQQAELIASKRIHWIEEERRRGILGFRCSVREHISLMGCYWVQVRDNGLVVHLTSSSSFQSTITTYDLRGEFLVDFSSTFSPFSGSSPNPTTHPSPATSSSPEARPVVYGVLQSHYFHLRHLEDGDYNFSDMMKFSLSSEGGAGVLRS
ncbi:hypothetical protein HAX54_032553 [Datura stramonium]|uniref:Uncharacterized protein n=1 Tax=Datura stramonium TaxID=4076 RepID=A0ABS8SCV2_DATST|nr:hypothetical protein [Datura stramonium]